MNERPSKSPLGGSNGTKFLIILSIVVVLLLVVTTGLAMVMSQLTPKSTGGSNLNSSCTDMTGKAKVTLAYSVRAEFEPDCIRVSSGTEVTYKNNSSASLEIGSDPHPVHTGNREVSDNQFDLDVEPGKTASATLTKKGTFGLHNHLDSSKRAKIIVE